MTLAKYLRERNLTPMEFARRIGTTDETVRRYMRGARLPAPDVMGRIARATRGVVTANDFYDMPRSVRIREHI